MNAMMTRKKDMKFTNSKRLSGVKLSSEMKYRGKYANMRFSPINIGRN